MRWGQLTAARVRIAALLAASLLLAAMVLPARALHAQPTPAKATLMGRVLNQDGERPLAGATVELPTLKRQVQTDSAGAFRLDSVPAGRLSVAVRLIGFDPVMADVQFVGGETIDTDFLLASNAQRLATVRVDTTRTKLQLAFMQEFDARRKLGFGRFLDPAFFGKNEHRDIRSVLTGSVPGLRIRRVQQKDILESSRMGQRCYPQIVVNNMVVYNGVQDVFDLTPINTRDILAFEYYGAGDSPLRFKGTGGNNHGPNCGTAIFWTK